MSRDHLTPAELAAYEQRELPPGDTLAASDHLAGCQECRTRLLELASSRGMHSPAPARADLTYEELADWLDDELDPLTRREVALNLQHSAQAAAELADLASFSDEMNAKPARDHAAELSAGRTASRNFPGWALALAAAVIVSAAAMWWGMSRSTEPPPFVKLQDGEEPIAFANDGASPRLAAVPESIAQAVAKTVRSSRVELTAEVAALAGATGTLAAPAEAESGFRVLEPVGTAVRDERPRFRWTAAAGASGYEINIVEETSGALLVSQQLPAEVTEWQPPEPLPAGELYQWEVQALRDGAVIAKSPSPPAPEARFRVLSKAAVAELEEAKRASRGSHLVMGIANARAGLLDDAIREFRLLAEQNPEAELPRQLLQQLESRRGDQSK